MKKFMILYLAPVAAEAQMNASPEEMKKGMEPWLAWFNKLGSALVEGGAPLGLGVHLSKRGSSKAKSKVTGYSIVQANDIEAAKAMIKGHPHFMIPKASIEVFEIMPMQM
jgi:hypothetical protein